MLALLLVLRVPVAFALLCVGLLGAFVVYGSFDAAMNQVALSILGSVTSFTLTAIPLFILMGEVLFRTRIAHDALEEISFILGRVPGRLSMVAVGGGALFGLLSGSTVANTALFGRTLLPDMRAKGYDSRLAAGSILAAGGLAMIIPPSALAILWGGIAQVPIGPLLIAGLLPGLIMAVGYVVVVLIWTRLGGAGAHGVAPSRTAKEAILAVTRKILLPGLIVVVVVGFIFFGIATTTESAAVGAVCAVLLALCSRRLKWKQLRDASLGTLRTTTMIFAIVLGSTLYAQLMSFSGASRGMVEALTGAVTGTAAMLAIMMITLLILGALIDQVSIMLITAPLFMPIVDAMGWDPIWFSILLLINLQIANTTPPFGMSLFVMKGVAPELKMSVIYRSVLPWIASDVIVLIMLATFPSVVLFLPGLMQ